MGIPDSPGATTVMCIESFPLASSDVGDVGKADSMKMLPKAELGWKYLFPLKYQPPHGVILGGGVLGLLSALLRDYSCLCVQGSLLEPRSLACKHPLSSAELSLFVGGSMGTANNYSWLCT